MQIPLIRAPNVDVRAGAQPCLLQHQRQVPVISSLPVAPTHFIPLPLTSCVYVCVDFGSPTCFHSALRLLPQGFPVVGTVVHLCAYQDYFPWDEDMVPSAEKRIFVLVNVPHSCSWAKSHFPTIAVTLILPNYPHRSRMLLLI